MSYIKCLELAGATVEMDQSFGSYQGDWWARIEYKGVKGWVYGSYGSCSGCDSFEGEFGSSSEHCDEHRYSHPVPDSCHGCEKARIDLERRMDSFGEGYLLDILNQEEAEKRARRYQEFWSEEDRRAFEFVRDNPI